MTSFGFNVLGFGAFPNRDSTVVGELFIWGANTYGMSGNGDVGAPHNTTPLKGTVAPADANFWQGGVRSNSSIQLVDGAGALWGIGRGYEADLGDGTVLNRSVLVQSGTDTDWLNAVWPNDSNQNTRCVVKDDGSWWFWGRNYRGKFGDGSVSGGHQVGANVSVPTQLGDNTNWKKGALGGTHVNAVKTDGTLWAWGDNAKGQRGMEPAGYTGTPANPRKDNSTVSSPIQVGTDTDWADIACTATNAVLAVKTDGTMWSWGRNYNGELGQGDTTDRSSPVQIGTDTNWVQADGISGGIHHFVALKTNGEMYAWGAGTSFALGNGNNDSKNVPTRIGTDADWYDATSTAGGQGKLTNFLRTGKVVAGDTKNLALKPDGTLWYWGIHQYGGPFNSTANNIGNTVPKQLGTGVTQMALHGSGGWYIKPA